MLDEKLPFFSYSEKYAPSELLQQSWKGSGDHITCGFVCLAVLGILSYLHFLKVGVINRFKEYIQVN